MRGPNSSAPDYGFVVGPVVGRTPLGCVVDDPRPEGRVVGKPASDGRVVAWPPVASVPPVLVLPPVGGVGFASSLLQPAIAAPRITSDIKTPARMKSSFIFRTYQGSGRSSRRCLPGSGL
jgi:hypothetical protein